MHRLLIISRPRILFENNAPFPLYRSYVFPSPQTCSFRFIFLVPGCFPFLRLFIFLLAPSPCFLSSLAARFPSFHSPPLPLHPTLSLISLDPAPPSLSFSIFFSSYSYSTLPSLTSLMSTVYFHHLASSLSLLSLSLPPPRSLFIVLHVQLCSGKEEKGRRRRGEKTSSIRLRPPSFANLRVLHLVLLSPRAPNASELRERTMPFRYFRFSLASLPLRVTPYHVYLDSRSFSFFSSIPWTPIRGSRGFTRSKFNNRESWFSDEVIF